jgi:hypothetical protein
MSTRYVYRPLDVARKEIRLLHIEGMPSQILVGYNGQHVTGRLEIVPLEEAVTTYVALSYVWGEKQENTSAVVLDDDTFLPMTPTLCTALLEINKHCYLSGLPIWIDAVCINQSDDVEKSWQVAQMGEIYKGAAKTLLYLGPEDDKLQIAMALINIIGDRVGDIRQEPHEYYHEPLFDHVDRLTSSYIKGTKSPSTTGLLRTHLKHIAALELRAKAQRQLPVILGRVMRQPWWRRVWVLQEFVLSSAPIFICGGVSMESAHLSNVFTYFRTITEYHDQAADQAGPTFRRKESALREYRKFLKYSSIPTFGLKLNRKFSRPYAMRFQELHLVLHDLYDSELVLGAKDPRDFIYSILGLATSWAPGQRRIKLDYTLSCVDVYVQTALSLVSVGCGRVLRLTVRQPRTMENLPTWTPDWGRLDRERKVKFNERMQNVEFNYVSEGHILKIPGRRVGAIHVISQFSNKSSVAVRPQDWNAYRTSPLFLALVSGRVVQRKKSRPAHSDRQVLSGLLALYMLFDPSVVSHLDNNLDKGLKTRLINPDMVVTLSFMYVDFPEIEQIRWKKLVHTPAEILEPILNWQAYGEGSWPRESYMSTTLYECKLRTKPGYLGTEDMKWKFLAFLALVHDDGLRLPVPDVFDKAVWKILIAGAFRLLDVALSLRKYTGFVCKNNLGVGVARGSIRPSDVLARFELDKDRDAVFALRANTEIIGTHEVVTDVVVPNLMTRKRLVYGRHTQFCLV